MITRLKERLFINLGNYRVLSILFLGFSAGIPLALTGSTLSMWLSRLGIDVKTIGLFSMVAIPYSYKYLWSSLFDYIPIPYFSKKFGLRRSWLILIQILLMASVIALGLTSPIDNITITALVALLVSFFSATQDIIIDALRIEILEKEEQSMGATMYVYGYRIAMLVSGAGSLLLADYISWGMVYFVISLSILIGTVAVIFLEEPVLSRERFKKLPKLNWSFNVVFNFLKTRKWLPSLIIIILIHALLEHLQANLVIKIIFGVMVIGWFYYKRKTINMLPDSLQDFSKQQHWLCILLFVIFYKFADTLLLSLQSKFYVDMGFSNSEIAYITKGFGFFMTLAGLFIGGLIYYRMGTFKSLFLAGVLQILSNLMFIWIANTNHDLVVLSAVIAVENFTGAISNVVIVAYLSSLCNIAYTATQYALLSSLSSMGRTIFSAPAGYLVAYFGWVKFFWITAIAGIPGIVLLCIIFKKEWKHGKS